MFFFTTHQRLALALVGHRQATTLQTRTNMGPGARGTGMETFFVCGVDETWSSPSEFNFYEVMGLTKGHGRCIDPSLLVYQKV